MGMFDDFIVDKLGVGGGFSPLGIPLIPKHSRYGKEETKKPTAVGDVLGETDPDEDAANMTDTMLRDLAVRRMNDISSRDLRKVPITDEEIVEQLRYANMLSLPADQRKVFQEEAQLDKLTQEYTEVLESGDEDKYSEFAQKLQSPQYAALTRSALGLTDDDSATAIEDAKIKAANENAIYLQELEYERGALLDFMDLVPEKVRGGMLLSLMENPDIREMFFPGVKAGSDLQGTLNTIRGR